MTIKELEVGSFLQNEQGGKYKIREKSGQLVWLSLADDFESGWRCFSIEDLLKINLKI